MNILIADDESSIRTVLSKALKSWGFDVTLAGNGFDALDILQNQPIDAAILDIRMPELSGLEILSRKDSFPSHPTLFIMTAQDTMENTVEAMKRGAYDYLVKPVDLDELKILLERSLETRNVKMELDAIKGRDKSNRIVGKSRALREIFKTIGRIADQDIMVLITGESGTGKELVAKAIHSQSKRASKPFVAVNCSAIPSELMESELFGSKKGAYTGATSDKLGFIEQASDGTLFLDEIGELPMKVQAKLLRLLQEKEFQKLGDSQVQNLKSRIIAATNRNLEEMVKKGTFREDLFFRLNVVPIHIPPLRERVEDIPEIATQLMNNLSEEFRMDQKVLSANALQYLKTLTWPGNVREMENLLKRVFLLSQKNKLDAQDFKMIAPEFSSNPVPKNRKELEELIEKSLEAAITSAENASDLYLHYVPIVERPLIRILLKRTKGNQLKTASALGINRNTLRKKIRELKIERRGMGR